MANSILFDRTYVIKVSENFKRQFTKVPMDYPTGTYCYSLQFEEKNTWLEKCYYIRSKINDNNGNLINKKDTKVSYESKYYLKRLCFLAELTNYASHFEFNEEFMDIIPFDSSLNISDFSIGENLLSSNFKATVKYPDNSDYGYKKSCKLLTALGIKNIDSVGLYHWGVTINSAKLFHSNEVVLTYPDAKKFLAMLGWIYARDCF